MRFTMKLEADNAAFDGADCAPEVARILRALADKVDAGRLPMRGEAFKLYDINGNHVGDFTRIGR